MVTVDDNCSSGSSFKLNFMTTKCESRQGGINCSIPIAFPDDPKAIINMELTKDQSAYFAVNSTVKSPLVVVARTTDVEYSPPFIAATANQLPVTTGTSLGVDLSNCNQVDCVLTNRIVLTSYSLDQTWYIVVQNTANVTKNYSLWFHDVCPPQCTIRGTCIDQGNDTGTCVCLTQDFMGLDCFAVHQNFAKLMWIEILAGVLVAIGVIAASSVFCLQSSRPQFRGEYDPIQ